jgi:hypothetical protein
MKVVNGTESSIFRFYVDHIGKRFPVVMLAHCVGIRSRFLLNVHFWGGGWDRVSYTLYIQPAFGLSSIGACCKTVPFFETLELRNHIQNEFPIKQK